ncbi:MAG TPA: SHOCT domain-containing protein [Ilumatobacteraceae bacterium]|nr:SHOCT domain-containing protein [Ilumatobacteraceae bacterium]
MMWWNGSWAWAWMVMVPMMVLMWVLIAWIVRGWARNGNDGPASPVERLDGRLAAGEISVDEYRTRRAELENRS